MVDLFQNKAVVRPLLSFYIALSSQCYINIDSSDVDFEAAKIKPYRLGNGVAIEFANGNQYSWRSVNLSGSKWILTKTEGIDIAKLKIGGLGSESTLTIVSDAPAPAELSLLIFVGWTQYIYIIQSAG